MHLELVIPARTARALALASLAAFAACDSPVTAPNTPSAASTANAAKGSNGNGGALPVQYVIPGSAVFPEGIAYDQRTQTVFVSSTTNGAIYRGDAGDETLTQFLPGGADGRTTATGLEVDDEGHLWVAGGGTGFVWVYDAASGALIARLSGGPGPTFINDIAVDRNGVGYITDSMKPVIYRIVPNAAGGYTLEPWLPLTGTAIQYVLPGFNLNGIVISPNGRYLYVVQSITGQLFRIEIATKQIVELDTGGALFRNGDGLWLHGSSLYVLQNQQELITELRVQQNQADATVVSQTTDPSFMYPTSLVIARGRMLVVNSQFDRRGPGLSPVLPFTVSVVPVP